MANDALLLSDIDAYYGDSHVLHRVSLRLGEGRLLGLLGRNGAGKSTCMSVAVGWLPPRRGSVAVYGAPVAGRAPEAIAAHGVALVPQGRRIFRSLTVRENLVVACAQAARSATRAPWTFERVCATFPRLSERRDQYAGHLSGGEQQMLAIGRALMSNPRVLLMDEPSEGLAPQIVAEVMATIRQLKEHGLSIVLVEQNAKLVFDVADDIVILNSGQVVVDDTVGSAAARRRRPAPAPGNLLSHALVGLILVAACTILRTASRPGITPPAQPSPPATPQSPRRSRCWSPPPPDTPPDARAPAPRLRQLARQRRRLHPVRLGQHELERHRRAIQQLHHRRRSACFTSMRASSSSITRRSVGRPRR